MTLARFWKPPGDVGDGPGLKRNMVDEMLAPSLKSGSRFSINVLAAWQPAGPLRNPISAARSHGRFREGEWQIARSGDRSFCRLVGACRRSINRHGFRLLWSRRVVTGADQIVITTHRRDKCPGLQSTAGVGLESARAHHLPHQRGFPALNSEMQNPRCPRNRGLVRPGAVNCLRKVNCDTSDRNRAGSRLDL